MDNPTCQSLGLHLWQVVRNPAATPVRVTTKYHDMTSRNNRFSCRIGHEADKHRSQSSVWNQAEIESIVLQQTLPSKYKRNSMLRILLTVALNDLHQFRDKTQRGKIQMDSGRVYWNNGSLLHHKAITK